MSVGISDYQKSMINFIPNNSIDKTRNHLIKSKDEKFLRIQEKYKNMIWATILREREQIKYIKHKAIWDVIKTVKIMYESNKEILLDWFNKYCASSLKTVNVQDNDNEFEKMRKFYQSHNFDIDHTIKKSYTMYSFAKIICDNRKQILESKWFVTLNVHLCQLAFLGDPYIFKQILKVFNKLKLHTWTYEEFQTVNYDDARKRIFHYYKNNKYFQFWLLKQINKCEDKKLKYYLLKKICPDNLGLYCDIKISLLSEQYISYDQMPLWVLNTILQSNIILSEDFIMAYIDTRWFETLHKATLILHRMLSTNTKRWHIKNTIKKHGYIINLPIIDLSDTPF